jgi:lipase chaperone LimK
MRNDERMVKESRRPWFGWGLGTVLLLLGGCYTGVDDSAPAELRSLAGVEVDGALVASAEGEVVLDADARAFFDHFLAAEGEVDEAALHARVRVEIDRRLHGEAAEQAWEAFLAYVDYRREAAALLHEAESLDPSERARVLAAALGEIRARTIGDAPGVPDEGPRLQAAASLQVVLSDPSLDARARAERVAAFQAEMGEAADPAAPSRILTRVHAALAPIPVDDVEGRRAVLIDLVGEAAAERWIGLERRRAEDLVARG